MIVSFEGPQGTSKTISAVALAYEEYRNTGRKIISNNHLTFPYTQFSMEYFLQHLADEEMEHCVLLLDEAYQYMDARMSQSKESRVFSYFTVQTRKRDVDLYVCTHSIENVDIRLRRNVDLRGACSYRIEKPCHVCKGTGLPVKAGASSIRVIEGKEYEVCPLCRGYKERDEEKDPDASTFVGYGRTFFLRTRALRGQSRRFTYDMVANQYFDKYNTSERMPIRSKMLTGIDTLEVV